MTVALSQYPIELAVFITVTQIVSGIRIAELQWANPFLPAIPRGVSMIRFHLTARLLCVLLGSSAFFGLLGVLPAYSQTDSTWNGGTGNWSNPLNWSTGVPNGNFNAFISHGNPGISTANLDINATVANLSLDSGNTLNILAGNALTFQSASGSTIDSAGMITVASTGAIVIGAGNSLSVTGGTIRLDGGSITGATGLESLTNLGKIEGHGTISGVGLFTFAGITVDGGTLTIQTNSDGFLTSGNVNRVESGSTLNITGGPFKNFDPSTGTLSGALFDLKGTLQFDNADIKNLRIFLGPFTLDGSGARIVNQFGQNALSSLSAISGTGINEGIPDFSLTNGATLTTNGGLANGYLAFLDISNGGAMTIGGNFNVGGLTQLNAGSMTVNGDVTICCGDVGSDMVVSNGSALKVHGSLTLAEGLVNFLAVSGSAATVDGDLNNLGRAGDSMFGGRVSITNGAAVNVHGNLKSTSEAAPFELSGGSALVVGHSLNNSGSLNILQGSTALVNGSVNNSGDIQIDHTSVVTARSGYTQTAGNTVVDGLLNAQGHGANFLGGTLSGTGIVNGNVIMGGMLMPGDPTGGLTIVGNYTQMHTGTLVEEVGWLSGFSFDPLFVMGNAKLDGTLDIKSMLGYFPGTGDSFILMLFNSSTGTFSNLQGLDFGGGIGFEVEYEQHDIRLVAKEVPEPGVLLLFATGLIALAAGLSKSYRRQATCRS